MLVGRGAGTTALFSGSLRGFCFGGSLCGGSAELKNYGRGYCAGYLKRNRYHSRLLGRHRLV